MDHDQLLAGSGLPRAEARALLAHLTGRRPEWLIAHGADPVAEALANRFTAAAARRRQGEPLAYLIGAREFYGRRFAVDPAVLIPRADTECLIDEALARLAGVASPEVLDLGTGSGAIALTLALERPDATVVATDRSDDALAVARRNATVLGAGRVDLRAGDWWQALSNDPAQRFDLIVSNPPYIAEQDPHLGQGDLRHEPRSALAAGPDGYDDLARIIAGAPAWLRPGGWLLLEHGHDQGQGVRDRLSAAGFIAVETRPDLEGRDRVGVGRRPPPAADAPTSGRG